MNKIKLLPVNEILSIEFYDGQLTAEELEIFEFCYQNCLKLSSYIQNKINNKNLRVDITKFYLDNKDECLKYDIEKIVYFDDIIFQSGLCYISEYIIREVVFNYLFSFHASLRRGKSTIIETFTFFN